MAPRRSLFLTPDPLVSHASPRFEEKMASLEAFGYLISRRRGGVGFFPLRVFSPSRPFCIGVEISLTIVLSPEGIPGTSLQPSSPPPFFLPPPPKEMSMPTEVFQHPF